MLVTNIIYYKIQFGETLRNRCKKTNGLDLKEIFLGDFAF